MAPHKTADFCKCLPPKRCALCAARQHAFCEALTPPQLEALRSRYFLISAKTHLYAQGAPLDETYTLCTGWLLLYKPLPDGKRQGIQLVLPGDFVGCQPGLAPFMQHEAVALTESTLCVFPHLEDVINSNSALTARMASLYARAMASKDDYLTYLAQQPAARCLAFLVLDLHRRLQQRGLSHGNTMPFPLTQEDIGAVLGLTPVHVSRIFHEWRVRSWIAIKEHQLTILNGPALHKLADIATITHSWSQPNR